MKIEREHLLKVLTVASLGLTKREILEQSNAYVFDDEHLVTFNGEILTKTTNPLKGITGAVPAEELHRLLSKFPDPEVEVVVKKVDKKMRALIIKGKRREAGIHFQKSVHLPYKDVPTPEEWSEAPEKLSGVLLQASRCCGSDESKPITTVVHIAADRVEATDNFRLFRYEMETGFGKPMLIPSSSLETLGGLVPEEIAQSLIKAKKEKKRSVAWAHLKMPEEHLVSIRCVRGDYPDIAPLMVLKNPQKVNLPNNLEDILSRAEVMQEAASEASVNVKIAPGQITITSMKEAGWFTERKKIEYDGETLAFSVHPKFLQEVLAKKKAVTVGGNRMKLKVKEATFVICLEVEGKKKAKEEDASGEEE